MRKSYKHGFALPRCIPDEHSDWSTYPVVYLSRREWISMCYRIKKAYSGKQQRENYIAMSKHPLGNGIICGDVPKQLDRMLCYADMGLINSLKYYWKEELYKELAKEVPNIKYVEKCTVNIELWSMIKGALE